MTKGRKFCGISLFLSVFSADSHADCESAVAHRTEAQLREY
ncbi:MAG: hypothetical protein V7L21_23145 [Nostoc sp.]